MTNEIYLSVAQAADLLGISQETLYKRDSIQEPHRHREPRQKAETSGHRPQRTLAPLRQHIHPRRLSRILRRQVHRLRENRAPAREPETPQGIGRDSDPRAKPQRPTQNRTPKPQIAHRDPRRPHQNHRQPNRRAGQNDINSSNAGEVSNLAIVKLSIILYMPVIFTNKLKVVGTLRGFSVKPSSVGGNSLVGGLCKPDSF